MTIGRGWIYLIVFLAGLIVGSGPDMSPEVQNMWRDLRSGIAALAIAAGTGAQDTGEFVRE